jgi:hypothetical protein
LSPLFKMQNDDVAMPKNAENNYCMKCNFKCSKQSNYKTHLLTTKHKMMMNGDKKMPKTATTHNCICGRSYTYRQGLDRHKKSCSHISNPTVIHENLDDKPSMMNIIMQNKEIMDLLVLQNEELKRQNKEQSDTIRELIPKIGNNNNNNNNIVTSTTNNQFNIQTFLNEDCKDAINFSEFIEQIKISFSDLENQAETGYVKGITKLFLENLQGLVRNKRPIHCSDKKRKTLYIKENDEWDKEGSHDTLKKGIQEITRRTMMALIKEKEDRSEEYSDMDSDFSMKCINIQRNLTPVAPREISMGKVASNISEKTIISDNQKNIE